MLPSSADDSISLDALILPALSPDQRSTLADVGYEGNYALDPNTMELCFRTQVAVRSVLLSANEWEFFMGSGEDITEDQSGAVKKWLSDRVEEYVQEARKSRGRLAEMRTSEQRAAVKSRIDLVEERWKEIETGLSKWSKET